MRTTESSTVKGGEGREKVATPRRRVGGARRRCKRGEDRVKVATPRRRVCGARRRCKGGQGWARVANPPRHVGRARHRCKGGKGWVKVGRRTRRHIGRAMRRCIADTTCPRRHVSLHTWSYGLEISKKTFVLLFLTAGDFRDGAEGHGLIIGIDRHGALPAVALLASTATGHGGVSIIDRGCSDLASARLPQNGSRLLVSWVFGGVVEGRGARRRGSSMPYLLSSAASRFDDL